MSGGKECVPRPDGVKKAACVRCHCLKVKCDHSRKEGADDDAGDGADKPPGKSASKKRKAPVEDQESNDDDDDEPLASGSQRPRKRVYRKQTQVEGGSDVDDLERSTRGLSIDTAAAGVTGEGEGRRTVSLSPSLFCGSAS